MKSIVRRVARLAVPLMVFVLAACGQTVQPMSDSMTEAVAEQPATTEPAPALPVTAATAPEKSSPADASSVTAPEKPSPADTPSPEPSAQQPPAPSSAGEPPAPPQSSTAGQSTDPGGVLVGRGFASVSVREGDRPRELVEGTRIEVSFERRGDHDVVRWRAGCNTVGGAVRIDADRLRIRPGAGTTVGCDEQRHQQEDWVSAFFHGDPFWELEGDRLTLTSQDVVMEFEPIPYW